MYLSSLIDGHDISDRILLPIVLYLLYLELLLRGNLVVSKEFVTKELYLLNKGLFNQLLVGPSSGYDIELIALPV